MGNGDFRMTPGKLGLSVCLSVVLVENVHWGPLDDSRMGNGKWGLGNGEWGMGNGEWGILSFHLG